MKLKKHQRLPLVIGIVAAVLIVLYFAVVRPLSTPPEETVPLVTTGPGEGSYLNKGTIFPHVPRENMRSITVHNAEGTFSFARLAGEGETPTAVNKFVILQEKSGGTVAYPHIPYDEERFSELVVATGTFYFLRNLGEEPELEGKTPVWSDYGLAPEDDPAWFELETLDGKRYKVYVGDRAVTDNGYYARLEGRDTVYVSNSTLVGETALTTLPSFVNRTLTSTLVNNAFYYNKDVTLWKTAPEGYRLTADDVVHYRYRTTVDGITSDVEIGSTDLRTARQEVVDAFLGKRLGGAPFTFTVSYPLDASYGEDMTEAEREQLEALRGKTVEYSIEEILRLEQLYIEVNYLNAVDRSEFHSGVAYQITGPLDKTGYLPNSNHIMGVLEGFAELVGTEAVAVGLDTETIEKYGLNAYCYYYETPLDIKSMGGGAGNVSVTKYLPNYLYISAKQADGTYYVGSVLTDIVAKVDGAVLAFLENPDAWWLENAMYKVNIGNVAEMRFDFNYSDVKTDYLFAITSKPAKDQFRTVTGVTYLNENRALSVDAFTDLYLHLAGIYYEGEYDGALPKEEVTAGDYVLALTLLMNDGEEYTYRFYPYSERHVLVSIEGDEGKEGAFFYILASSVEKIYNDIGLVLKGEAPDPGKRY